MIKDSAWLEVPGDYEWDFKKFIDGNKICKFGDSSLPDKQDHNCRKRATFCERVSGGSAGVHYSFVCARHAYYYIKSFSKTPIKGI